jgi:hypothetical protein
MKKILLLVVSFVLFGCASITVPTEFDPTATPFEGEWNALWTDGDNKFIETHTFTGNRWEYTWDDIDNDDNDVYLTGLFNYNDKQILFSNENGKWTQGYEFIGSYRFNIPQMKYNGYVQADIHGYFTKQPYGDLAISYVTKERKFSDIVSNREELASIQGSWRTYNRRATYTFSGDQFTLTATGKRPVTGTVKIRDNILYLIISDEQFGMYYLDFLPNNNIFLNELLGHPELWWGEFIKQ